MSLLALGSVAGAQGASTLPVETAADRRSGDDWIDLRLEDINAYAARYPAAFVDEVVRYLDAPREFVETSVARRGVEPGDVYFACAIARVSGQPCRRMLEAWQGARAEGWVPVASRHGVAPGTPGAARVRELIQASYGRWARPEPTAPGQGAKRPAGRRE
ncbi:hypothetical protein [Luteimonas vadosa]|uniref:Secreted protein n=1 Tax=Luteimonas vadosa TaxID=1165507 RepID=A0ABP9DNN3_9GAMM